MKNYILNYQKFLIKEATDSDVEPTTLPNKKLGNLWILANAKKIKENYEGENLFCYEFVRAVIRLSLGGGDGKSNGDQIAQKLLSGFANNELGKKYPDLSHHGLILDDIIELMKNDKEPLRGIQKALNDLGLGEAFDDATKAQPGDFIQYWWTDFQHPKVIEDKKLFSITGHAAIVGEEDSEFLYTIGSGASKGFNGKHFTKIKQPWTFIPKKNEQELINGVTTTDKDGKKYKKYYRTFFFRFKEDLLKKYYTKDNIFIEAAKNADSIENVKMDDKKPNLTLIKNSGNNKTLMV